MGFILPFLWLELLLAALSCFVIFICKDFNYWKNRNVPFIPPFSLYGNVLSIIALKKSINQYLDELHRESVRINSKYIGFWVAEKPSLYISDPNVIKKILIQDFANFNDRLVGYKSKSDSLGRSSMFLMKQNHWKNMRSRLSYLFSSGKIKKMEKTVCNNSKNMLHFIEKHNKFTDTQPLNSRDLATRYSADNIVEVYLGLDGQCLKDMPGMKLKIEDDKTVPRYNDIGNSIMSISAYRALEFSCFFLIPEITSYLRFQFYSPGISKFFREIFMAAVNIRRNQTNQSTMKDIPNDEQKAPKDLLDLLIQFEDDKIEVDGMKYYERDVMAAQFANIFIAGFETSSSSISLFLSTMTQYPDIQDRVRDEIKNVLGKYGELNYDSLSETTYLDMAYKETLRLYPTLPFVDRICTNTYKLEGTSLVIEKGTKIFISLTGMHLDPRYWKDPHRFDPERFSPENKSSIIPFTYLPFGEGPKACIGERAGMFKSKMGIATILSKYRVRSDGTLKTCNDLGPSESYEALRIPMASRGVVLTPDKPLTMYFDYMPVN